MLAAVAVAGGTEVSRTCSRFVSVSSSLDGVTFKAGSDGIATGVPTGVLSSSAPGSISIGGGSDSGSGRCCSSTNWSCGDSPGTSSTAGEGATLGALAAATGLAANMLAQLFFVPSGIRLLF